MSQSQGFGGGHTHTLYYIPRSFPPLQEGDPDQTGQGTRRHNTPAPRPPHQLGKQHRGGESGLLALHLYVCIGTLKQLKSVNTEVIQSALKQTSNLPTTLSSLKTIPNQMLTYSCFPGFMDSLSMVLSYSVRTKSKHPLSPNAPHSVLTITWNRKEKTLIEVIIYTVI